MTSSSDGYSNWCNENEEHDISRSYTEKIDNFSVETVSLTSASSFAGCNDELEPGSVAGVIDDHGSIKSAASVYSYGCPAYLDDIDNNGYLKSPGGSLDRCDDGNQPIRKVSSASFDRFSFEGRNWRQLDSDQNNLQKNVESQNIGEIVERCKTHLIQVENEMKKNVKQVLDRYRQRTEDILTTLEKHVNHEDKTNETGTKFTNNSNLGVIKTHMKRNWDFLEDSDMTIMSENDLSANSNNETVYALVCKQANSERDLQESILEKEDQLRIRSTSQPWLLYKLNTGEQKVNDNFNKETQAIESNVLPETSIVKHLELKHTPRVIQYINDGTLVALMENNLLYRISKDSAMKFDSNIEDISYCSNTNTLFCLWNALKKTHVSSIDTTSGRFTQLFELKVNQTITYMGTSVDGLLVLCGDQVEHDSIFKSFMSKRKATGSSIVNKITVRTRDKGAVVASKTYKEFPCNISVCKSTGKVALAYFDECDHQRRPCVQVMNTKLVELYRVIGPSYSYQSEHLIPRTIFDTRGHLIIADHCHIHLFQAGSGEYIRHILKHEMKISCLSLSIDDLLVVGQCFSKDLLYFKYLKE